ncbi:MAG TPA: alpha/beta hydrolase [Streptosporangiaceae bacterium]|nr:alpha/beta hydrolase [Streptosporangiaceae bacterium]
MPLNYHEPGTTITVAVSRLRATDPALRRGVLLMNPGGPGDPGLDWPGRLITRGLPASVRASYDLIGFDPRGIGRSTPVTCELPPELQTSNLPPYARDAVDVARQAAVAEQIAKLCATSDTAALLPYINTVSTAKDMEQIRLALGEERISFLGQSYGTYLAAVYATLFPDRTDRFVLNSVSGTGGFDVTAARRFAIGFEDRFPDFAAWAARRNATYRLGATPAQVTAKYFELAERLDRSPILGLDGAQFRTGTRTALYSDEQFSLLAFTWMIANQVTRSAAAQPNIEHLLAGQLHVACNDSDWPESVLDYQLSVAISRITHPMYGPAAANIWPCAFWREDPVDPPVRISDQGLSNMLLVQNMRDPGTPLVGALEMRRALGDRARMIVVDQGGHGAYLNGNTCADNAVARFLVDGQRPPQDTSCAKEPAE